MFQSVILRLGLRYISRRLFQSVLFILGVALGVAVVIAIDLANGSASRAFALSSQTITGNATHQISGTSSGLSTELYRDIRIDLGIRDSAPVVNQTVRASGVPQSLQVLGVDPFAEPPFRDYLTEIEVMGEEEIDPFEALTRFIAEPRTVLLSDTLASDIGIDAGDTIELIVNSERIDVTVIGVLVANTDLSRQALDNLLLTDIATAQEVLDFQGRITRIDLIIDADEQIAAVRDILPQGATLVNTQDSGGALAQMTDAFEINLQALSLLAVVVGVFLIYNTVTFSVVQRRPMIGILRSVGATRRQIFTFIIGEALTLGIIGTVLGMALGVIFGRFTVALVSQTINDLYFSVTVNTVTVDPLSLLKGATLGIVASVGAAIIPSWDATRTLPAGSMKRSSIEEETAGLVPYITIASAVCFALGYLLLQIPTTSLIISFTALFFVIFGGALLTPAVLILLLRVLLPVTYRLFGVLGPMSARAITRSLSRTSIAVAALTIAVSVIIGVSVMIGSFRNTVTNWLENTLTADIYISPPTGTATGNDVTLDPEIATLVSNTEGVARVSTNRTVDLIAPNYPDLPPVNVNVIDFDLAGDARQYVWQDGSPVTALEEGRITVSEPFAFRRGITQANNTLTLLTPAGEQPFEIAGVFYDYTTDQGIIFMGRETYDQYWDDPTISAVAAYVSDVDQLETVVERLEQETLAGYEIDVQSNRTLRQSVFDVFDRTFSITIALRLLATIVAFIGILSALMSLQLEHRREYGVMRANGMTPSQLRQYAFIQTGLMGIIAGVLAIPIGILLAMVLVYVINVRSFGWTMQFAIIWGEVGQAFLVAIGAALLAGVYPAYELARMNVSRAIRSE
jgi:putative ABC transport system permease protein